MNLLGINGSPRIGGNTDILLGRALEGARNKGANVEKVVLNDLNYSACQECENIKDDGSCIIEDDFQLIYKKVESTDGLIIASPVFFGSLSAQTKAMVDRFQCTWRAKYILQKDVFKKKKVGALILVEASDREDFFDNAKSIIKNLFATLNVKYKWELFCPDVDKKGDVLRHSNCLEEAYGLGQKIANTEVG